MTTEVKYFGDKNRHYCCLRCNMLWATYGPTNYCPCCGRKIVEYKKLEDKKK